MAKQQQKSAEEIIKAIQALRPGVLVDIGMSKDKKLIQLRVREVSISDMEEFASVIGTTIPQVMTAISSFIREEIASGGKFTWRDLEENPGLFTQALARPALIGRIVPLAIQSLADMIDRCVEPSGVFKRLPHDMAAPVIRQWIELNLLDPGKVRSWVESFQGLTEKLRESLPALEQSSVS